MIKDFRTKVRLLTRGHITFEDFYACLTKPQRTLLQVMQALWVK